MTEFLFGMRGCTVDSDVNTGDFSLVLGILHVCGHVLVRSHKPPGMDCLTSTVVNILKILSKHRPCIGSKKVFNSYSLFLLIFIAFRNSFIVILLYKVLLN